MEADNNRNESDSFEAMTRSMTYFILFILPPFLLISGSWNLYLAYEMGIRDSYTLTDLLQRWNDGLDISRQYSHSYLMAMKRISNAFMQLGSAILMITGGAVYLFMRKGKKEQ